MKLSYKIFGVNLVVSFLLIFLMGTVARFYAVRHFNDQTRHLQSEMLTALSYELSAEFQRTGSWQPYENSDKQLEQLVHKVLGPPPPDPLHSNTNPSFTPPMQGPPAEMVLLNADKTLIAGPAVSDMDDFALKAIYSDGQVAGWIGMEQHPMPGPQHPSLNEKLNVLYTISLLIFILTGVVSYFFSRHILSPIAQMTKGTQALARFKFDTRIRVDSKDELGRLALDFNRMAKTLQAYETLQKQWIVDISHELRTPLSILKGEIEAIRDKIHRPSEQRIQSLHEEIIHLEKIIEDLHLLSTADSKILYMRSDIIQPVAVLTTQLALLEARLKEVGLTLDCRLKEREQYVLGDKGRIKQLFSNIIENNLKYTARPGKIIIHSTMKGRMLMISFEDTGPGVPADSIDRLFDRLYRVDASRSRQHGGTGLGLSICKTIVTAHEGVITAENVRGGGLRINIELPVVKKNELLQRPDC